jgi:outer membrane protein assembly factor BamB
VVCVDARSGKVLWTRTEVDPEASDVPYKGMIALHGYASHTPAADASGVYVYFGAAGAVGYTHSGERMWGPVRFGTRAKVQNYGSAASPLLFENLLIVNATVETAALYEQGETVALDTRTGREVWRVKAGGNWSSPALATVDGKAELVVATHHPGPWLGLDPRTGTRLWECQGKDGCGTPVVHDGVVYTFHGEGRAAIRAGGRGDVTDTHKLWETTGGLRIASPVYHDGHLYWSGGHVCHCTDARTGRSVYRERLGKGGDCYASPVLADGRLYYVSRDRGTYVVAASPNFELLAHNTIDDDKSVFNGSPAVSGGRLFLRSDKYMYCIGTK